jgi:hypothetical protein
VPTGLGSTYIPSSNTPITISSWFRAESISDAGTVNRIINLHDVADGNSSAIFLSLGLTNRLQALIDGGAAGGTANVIITSPTAANTASWFYGAVIYDGDVGILLQNGVEGSRTATGTKLNAGADWPAKIGMVNVGTPSAFYDGMLDEVRISSVARSTNWVWAEYRNIASNTVFNSYGAVSGGGTVVATPRYFYRPNLIMRPNAAVKNQESPQ